MEIKKVPQSVLLAAGLTAATVAGAEAQINRTSATQTKCSADLLIFGFDFIDRYPIDGVGRPHIIDAQDFVMGSSDFGEVKLVVTDPQTKKETVIASTNMVDKGSYSTAQVHTPRNIDCNTNGKAGEPALEVGLRFTKDTDNVKYTEVIDPGKTRVHVAGREEKNLSAIEKFVSNPANQLIEAGDKVNELTEQIMGQSLPLSESNPKDNTSENRQAILSFLNKAIAAETKIPTPTPAETKVANSTASVTSTVTQTVSPTVTSTPVSSLGGVTQPTPDGKSNSVNTNTKANAIPVWTGLINFLGGTKDRVGGFVKNHPAWDAVIVLVAGLVLRPTRVHTFNLIWLVPRVIGRRIRPVSVPEMWPATLPW